MVNFRVPGSIQFYLPGKTMTNEEQRYLLPTAFAKYSIQGAHIQYTEGPFGCYFQQEISDRDWTFGWINFFLTRSLQVHAAPTHPMVSLQVVLQGEIDIELGTYGPALLSAQQFNFIYTPPLPRSICSLRKGNYEIAYFSFSSSFLESFLELHPRFREIYDAQQAESGTADMLPAFSIPPMGIDILYKIRMINPEDTLGKFNIRRYIHDILALYFMALLQEKKTVSPYKEELENALHHVKEYIRKNYQSHIAIPKLSQLAGMNTTSLEKGFKQLYARTPREYLEFCRIQQAAWLLKNTQQQVKEITYAVGFTDPNYFSQVFRKHFNVTPSMYRKMEASAEKF
ncbi:helix-turn-helix transcriptional regulator [Chitinophaga solisilvae]|uniref:Helix-turn-helix transcriptional regulator n=1 Tax=Chitinophaga solisilvae TaxID=1233460 RepID=A0A3S1AZT6_9BACT|nr:AraC family transcriptional regulator [Chitinophaga solisilvae]NSL90768.1 helix-turn-helix transcriptional regulator [Chitinophaga solisilvae]